MMVQNLLSAPKLLRYKMNSHEEQWLITEQAWVMLKDKGNGRSSYVPFPTFQSAQTTCATLMT